MSFPVIFRFISGEISGYKNFWNIFIAQKDSSLNFRESLLSYFWAILLIYAVITILKDFDSLLPARTVTVKSFIFMTSIKSPDIYISNILSTMWFFIIWID